MRAKLQVNYYAFGLRIAGISSRKFDSGVEGDLINHYLYNDKEFFEDADLGWYDYGFRNYDPQIGRFAQLDPLTWDYPELTNYQYASNEPIANVDLDGLEALPSIIHEGTWFNLPQVLEPVTITAKVSSPIAVKGLSLFKASSLLFKIGLNQAKVGLENAGKEVAWFGKGMWNKGVLPTVDWVNHNLNPAYGVFNGINSQFTGQDFLSGEPMTRADGTSEFLLSAFPVLKLEGAAAKQLEKQILNGTRKVAAKGVRNSHLAGKVHPKTGVPFDKAGFSNFSKNLYKGGVNDVMIKPTGNRVADFAAANKAAGSSSTPKGYTWHHHQTTGRMQLVETGVHSKTGHTGGFSLWKY